MVEVREGIVGDVLELPFDAFSITPLEHCYPKWLDLDHPKDVRPIGASKVLVVRCFSVTKSPKVEALGRCQPPPRTNLKRSLSHCRAIAKFYMASGITRLNA